MKKIKITEYIVEGEAKKNTDVLELDFNAEKWGDDEDVLKSWIQDEVKKQFGVELESWKMAA